MSAYGAYPEYRDSGVEWIPEYPSEWNLAKIKYCARLNPSKNEVRSMPHDLMVSFLPMEAISEDGVIDASSSKPLSNVIDGYTYIGEGDVCIAKITPCFENGKGAVATGLTNKIAFATTEMIPLRPYVSTNAYYLYYLLSSAPFRLVAEGSMYGAGGQKRVADTFVANYDFACPPTDLQEQIANFLDHETAKIDTLIEKQQQLIKLLKEKRQAVISHAVTKGLDPDAPMKDSGVEWLGEVPEHWRATRLKFLVSQVVDCHHSTPDYAEDAQWPALRTSDVFPGVLDVENARRVPTHEYLDRISRLKPVAGDVIYAREGGRWGVAAPIPEGAEVCLAQRVMLLRGNDRMISQFVMWSLNSRAVYNQLAINVVGSASPHVNIGDVLEVWLAEPPIKDQPEIIERLELELSKTDLLERKCAQVIQTLQERRTALISAAVTGKIDVRNWQAPESTSTSSMDA